MLLFAGSHSSKKGASPDPKATNIVIGYNGSPNSQTALDFALWMAHQTRLVTNQQVIVHVVYVLEGAISPSAVGSRAAGNPLPLHTAFQNGGVKRFPNSAVAMKSSSPQRMANPNCVVQLEPPSVSPLVNSLEQADRILWQARCMADEWRGSLEAHLRFGSLGMELRHVVQSVKADVLFVGCSAEEHPLIQQLIQGCSCPILGIPTELESQTL